MINAQIDLEYQLPHEDILSLADAPLPPLLRMNSDGDEAILLYRNSFKSIEELSEKEMRLGGLRINPKTNNSSRARYYNNIEYYDIGSMQTSTISGLPKVLNASNILWSPDDSKIAFTNTVENGLELWVIDLASKSAKAITDPILNGNMGSPMRWFKNSQELLVKFLPDNRPALIDAENSIPNGPTVSVNESGTKAQNRTYQDLLKNADDEHNFKVLATSALKKVSVDGTISDWKDAGMYNYYSFSPDGEYIFVSEVKEPFSYIVPYYRFPTSYDFYTKDGKFVTNFTDVPLTEEMPKGFMSVRTGRRGMTWRDDKAATIVWAEALDGGDAEKEVEYRDAVYSLNAPFDGEPEFLANTKLRYSGIDWGNDKLAVIYDYWWNTRTLRTSFFNPSNPDAEHIIFNERNYQDRYSDPGTFVNAKNNFGMYTLDVKKDDQLFLIGDGYSEDGKHPFVDVYDIGDKSTKRIYQSKDDEMLESVYRMMDSDKGDVLIRLESKSEYPNFYYRNIYSGELTPITDFENPFKAIQSVHKEVITYKRDDGIDLSATLYLPVGYEKGVKYPMIMWAYPREYKDKSSAGQVTSSSNEFTYPYYGSPLYWVNRGYVVLDDAAFPIIGEGEEEPNDSFIKQLVANAKAGIDAVDNMGYIDRDKVAVGGHSYGAFMTANLLTHSDLFAAGIARSGAYNRTLTPFGFQSEERNYWEAPEIYYEMSPFMHCDKMKTPLLLIHGEADNNSGTYPMQSERYFNALKGLGAPVRLVILPKESHGYAARENIMHLLW